jgi:hypothetical protein
MYDACRQRHVGHSFNLALDPPHPQTHIRKPDLQSVQRSK